MYVPNLNAFVERTSDDFAASGVRPVDPINFRSMSMDIRNRHGTFLDTSKISNNNAKGLKNQH
jgi:hypothetical protein